MVVVVVAMMMVSLRKARRGEQQNDGKEKGLFHSPIISPNQRTAIQRKLLFWVRSESRMKLCVHEKSSIAFTEVPRLCRVRKKKTSAMSR
jgi:hypothetical protein